MFVSNELGLVSNKDVGSASEEEVGSVSDEVVLVLVLDEEADENFLYLYPVEHLAPFRDDCCYLGDSVSIAMIPKLFIRVQ